MPDTVEEYEALLQFLYVAPVGLVQTDLDGEIGMINPISSQLLMPLSSDGELSNLFTVLQNVAPGLRALVARYDAPHGMVCDALRLQLRAGSRAATDPQMLTLTILKLNDDRLMAVLTDVTETIKRERLLKQNEAWLNAILTGISDYALVSLDQNGLIDDWNDSIGRVTGYDRSAVVGRPYSFFHPGGAMTADGVPASLREADENGWTLDDGWLQRADGTRFWSNSMISPMQIRDDCPVSSGYCMVIRDITDKRKASDSLLKTVSCDYLTGIANRRAFFETAEAAIARWPRAAKPMTLILFDADHFKAVNDRYGHPAGDAVLCHFAALLTASFQESDAVARIGGEEFAVLMPSTDPTQALRQATALINKVAAEIVIVDGVSIRYTVSGGLAAMEASVVGVDALIKRADEALYSSKAAGRNRVTLWEQP